MLGSPVQTRRQAGRARAPSAASAPPKKVYRAKRCDRRSSLVCQWQQRLLDRLDDADVAATRVHRSDHAEDQQHDERRRRCVDQAGDDHQQRTRAQERSAAGTATPTCR